LRSPCILSVDVLHGRDHGDCAIHDVT
jgi:hypothetical protein